MGLVSSISTYLMITLQLLFAPHDAQVINFDFVDPEYGMVKSISAKRSENSFTIYENKKTTKELFKIVQSKESIYKFKILKNDHVIENLDLNFLRNRKISFKESNEAKIVVQNNLIKLVATERSLYLFVQAKRRFISMEVNVSGKDFTLLKDKTSEK